MRGASRRPAAPPLLLATADSPLGSRGVRRWQPPSWGRGASAQRHRARRPAATLRSSQRPWRAPSKRAPANHCRNRQCRHQCLTTTPMQTTPSYLPLLAMALATTGSSNEPGTQATWGNGAVGHTGDGQRGGGGGGVLPRRMPPKAPWRRRRRHASARCRQATLAELHPQAASCSQRQPAAPTSSSDSRPRPRAARRGG